MLIRTHALPVCSNKLRADCLVILTMSLLHKRDTRVYLLLSTGLRSWVRSTYISSMDCAILASISVSNGWKRIRVCFQSAFIISTLRHSCTHRNNNRLNDLLLIFLFTRTQTARIHTLLCTHSKNPSLHRIDLPRRRLHSLFNTLCVSII